MRPLRDIRADLLIQRQALAHAILNNDAAGRVAAERQIATLEAEEQAALAAQARRRGGAAAIPPPQPVQYVQPNARGRFNGISEMLGLHPAWVATLLVGFVFGAVGFVLAFMRLQHLIDSGDWLGVALMVLFMLAVVGVAWFVVDRYNRPPAAVNPAPAPGVAAQPTRGGHGWLAAILAILLAGVLGYLAYQLVHPATVTPSTSATTTTPPIKTTVPSVPSTNHHVDVSVSGTVHHRIEPPVPTTTTVPPDPCKGLTDEQCTALVKKP